MGQNPSCDANFRLLWKNRAFMKTEFMTFFTNERHLTLLWTSQTHCTCCQFLKLNFNIILPTQLHSPWLIMNLFFYLFFFLHLNVHTFLSVPKCFVLCISHATWFNHIIEIPGYEFWSISFRAFLHLPVISSAIRPTDTDHHSNLFSTFLNTRSVSVCYKVHNLNLNSFFNPLNTELNPICQ